MLCYRLSTTLLLAATCLLMTAVVSTEKVVTCGSSGNVQRLSCESGVIVVQAALYGRADNETCSEGRPQNQLANTQCAQKGTVDVLRRRYFLITYVGQVIFVYGADYGRRDRTTCSFGRPTSQILTANCSRPTTIVADSCNGKNRCSINVSNSVFGDPCSGTYKYLEVAYICESSVISINCLVFAQTFACLTFLYFHNMSQQSISHCPLSSALNLNEDILVLIVCSHFSTVVLGASWARSSHCFVYKAKTVPHWAEEIQVFLFLHPSVPLFSQTGSSNIMLCYRLSTTLLLAATCLLMTAVVSTEKVVTCGSSGNVQRLSCESGVIVVQAALYGRADNETCSEGRPQNQLANTQCAQKGTVDVLRRRCDGKRECELNVNLVRNFNPCRGIYKYLETTFTCFPAIHFAACEGSVAHLKCGNIFIFLVCIYGGLTGSSNIMLCYRLSTTLLLAATCLLMTAVVSTEKVVTCGSSGNVQRLSCESGVIVVQAALYGRADNETCSEGRPQNQLANTQCAQKGTVDVLRRRCDGKRECELNVNLVRNFNPCRGIYKYLETTFTCFPAIHFAACEGSVAHLKCDVGQVIFVYGADYGRRDRTTCSFGRPTSQILTANCSRPTTIVADSCNGKNRCSINVSNSVFGDPCGGTYKYLEVAYICEYPGVIPYQPPVH
uniref:uncharacterized protein LOC117258119 n=1 Tax=Epinephelus lanceolatus TaxID=310571 RepID=UPI001445A295|nr:uncharacterized protein LOC117258119 [Epinephelus lanceolatus]